MTKKLLLRSKNILFTCFLLLIAITSNAQPDAKYSWAKGFTNNSIASIATVATDDSGNVYSAGFFYTNLVSLSITNKGSSDILLMKHSASGTLKWVKTIASVSLETADGIAIDANHNIYIVGRFDATTDFDPGTGTANLTSKGGTDIFLAKYTTNGDYVWAKDIGGTGTEAANKIVVDASGNVYITGLFNATVDFNPDAGVANLSSNVTTTYDVFFAKYTTNGTYVWAKSIGNFGDDRGYGIAVDANGSVYVAGDFQGTADFNPSTTATNNLTAAGTNDMFYAKYDANGAYVWAKRVGTVANYVSARDIKLDADKNIYVVGVFETNTDFDPSANISIVNSGGVYTGFVAKYNSLGNYVWAFGNGGSGSIYHIQMGMDKLKSVYVTGFFDNTCDFDPSATTANLTSAGNEEIYLAKYDTDGKYKWAKRIGSTGNDQSGGIAVDTSFNVFISGYYSGTVDFDPSAATANLSSVTGTSSAFVAKYTQTGICFPIASTFTVTACNSYTWAAKGNKVYTVSNNTDTIKLLNANGCDSIVTLNLTVKYDSYYYTTREICNYYIWNGVKYDSSGTYTYTTKSANGCDSISTLKLTIYKPTSSNSNISACSSYTWNNTTYTNSGTYTYHTVNANGCDSTATLNLTINKPSATLKEITICSSQLPYTIDGFTFTQEGKQSRILTNANGCDSIVTYILSSVNDGILSNVIITQPQCDSLFGSISATYYDYVRVFRGTIDSTDQKQIGRLNITAQPTSSCSVSSTNPGLLASDTKQRFYESYSLTNTTGATACVSVNLKNYNPSNIYTIAAYSGSFNATNPSQNYLAHLGSSLGLGNAYFYFSVPANTTFEIVVSNYLTGNFFGDYTLEVSGLEAPEFSINNGLNWKNSNNFNAVPIGNSNLIMRSKGTQCITPYFNNPITIKGKVSTASTTNLSICSSVLPYSWNGLTFTAAGSQTKTGLTNSQGCDSAATLNLTVTAAPVSSFVDLIGCQSVVYKGKTYIATTTFKDTTRSILGCDSIYTTVNITVRNATITTTTQNLSGCNKLVFNSKAYTTSTTVRDTLHNSFGCDSVYNVTNIIINVITPSNVTENLSGANSVLYNSIIYTNSTVIIDTLKSLQGCDSVYKTIDITVTNIPSITNKTMFFDTLKNVCDSLVSIALRVKNFTNIVGFQGSIHWDTAVVKYISLNIANTPGLNSSVYKFDQTKSSKGYIIFDYIDINTNSFSVADSAALLMLNFSRTKNLTRTTSIDFTANPLALEIDTLDIGGAPYVCPDPLFINGQIGFIANTRFTTTVNLSGCNSVVYEGTTYASSVQKRDTIKGYQGCDSIYKIANITVTPITPNTVTVNLVGCNSVVYGGSTYTSSVQKRDTIRSYQGCDSIYKVANITITPIIPIAATLDLVGCNSVVFNGTTYLSSTTKRDTLKTIFGCDSIYRLINLTVKTNTSSTSNLSICPSALPYSWNGLKFTATGSQTKTGLLNSQGCDSSATLNLTVKINTSSTTNLSICPSALPYNWNGLTFTAAGSQTKTGLINSQGCDSSATLNLTLRTLPNAGVINGNSSFCFIGGSTTLTSSGDVGGVWTSSNSSRVTVTSGGKVTASTGGNYIIYYTVTNTCSTAVASFNIKVNVPSSSTISLSACNSYTWGGTTYTTSGIYTKTGLTNAGGCDSTATLDLTIKKSTSSIVNQSVCNSFTWNGVTYTTSGTYTKAGMLNKQGCDSSATLNLTVKTNTSSTSNLSICPSALPYNWNGLTFTAAGSQTKTGLINSQGCDSSATLNLTVKTNTSSTSNLSICPSALPYSWNGLTFTATGSQTKTGLINSQGCDSSATLNLTVKTNTSSTSNLSICPSALPYSWNGLTFTAAGSQTKTGLLNSQSCDSSATLNLTVKTNTSSTSNLSICPSALPYSWNGLTFTAAGSQTKTGLLNSQSCDSSATLNLTVKTNTSSTSNLSICPSALPYSWNGLTFTATGSQTKTGLINSQGCDSSATLNLTVKTNTSSTSNLSICPSALPYSWNGLTFTAAGSQTKTGLLNSQGCDSSATLNLTVKTNTSSTSNLSICPSALPYSWNGLTFTAAGSQTKTGLINSQGCDSSATLNLTVKAISYDTINKTICSGQVYLGHSSAGTYTDTLINSVGCDSIRTLNLVIIPSLTPTVSVSTLTQNVCKGYVTVFNAIATNQGTNAIYQWYKNATTVGTNATTYRDSLLNNEDSIWCVLTSSETCVTANNIKSNVIKMNVSLAIAGSIKTPIGTAISDVTLYRTGSIADTQIVSKVYNESCITSIQYGSIRPAKNNDVKKNNGVSGIDVILVTNHILSKAKLNSPYKLIAADVNNNKTITNIDLIFIKRLILGIDTTFTGNKLWTFVDSAYQFADTTNPFPYKDSISFSNLTSNKSNQSFIGVKLGDVNYDWNPAVAKGMITKPLELVIDKLRIKNDELRIPITVKNFRDLTALQYTLSFNNKNYEFVGIENNKLGIEYNEQQATRNGSISFLWTDTKGVEKNLEDGSELFTLVLKGKRRVASSEWGINNLQLTINNSITEVEAWDKDNQQHNIILTKQTTQQEPQTSNTKQWVVSPNPNDGNIVVSLSSNTNKTIVFEVSSAVGKTLYKQSVEAVKGNNVYRLNLNKNAKLPTGVYFIKAIGLEGENVKRIVVRG